MAELDLLTRLLRATNRVLKRMDELLELLRRPLSEVEEQACSCEADREFPEHKILWVQVYQADSGAYVTHKLGMGPSPETKHPSDFMRSIVDDGELFTVWMEENFLREDRCRWCREKRCVQKIRYGKGSVMVIHDAREELS